MRQTDDPRPLRRSEVQVERDDQPYRASDLEKFRVFCEALAAMSLPLEEVAGGLVRAAAHAHGLLPPDEPLDDMVASVAATLGSGPRTGEFFFDAVVAKPHRTVRSARSAQKRST